MGLDINKFTLTKSAWDILYPKMILHLSFSVYHLQEADIWHTGDTLIKSFCDGTGITNIVGKPFTLENPTRPSTVQKTAKDLLEFQN